MASRDDDRFRIKPGMPRSQSGPQSRRFVSQVLKQVSRSGAPTPSTHGRLPASTFGRGRVAAGMARRTLGAAARRVVIKSRFVVLKKAGANSVSTHLRYIERDGVTCDGTRGQGYGPDVDSADLKAFEERGCGDRHQFRFIVSVEDAEQLDDLRGYTRVLMQRLSTDLETSLDWVAVDHWDTDNPHTHIVLRGRAANGQDLVIAPDYMAHGMRARASELATKWLGPRTELEIRQSLLREVDQKRMTSLDRGLIRHAVDDVVDVTNQPGDLQRQSLLRARLQRLETMQLAEQIDVNHWRLSPTMEPTLTALGDRGDILRVMHKALRTQSRELVMAQERSTAPVTGCIAAKGLGDELSDRAYLLVDGVDGRAHYLHLPAGTDLSALPVGGIVQVNPPQETRAVDQGIVDIARGGIYKPADQLTKLQREGVRDSQFAVERNVRRLEALRRSGIVSRDTDGNWRVPRDLLVRAQAHDARRTNSSSINLRSSIPLAEQTRAIGATWLDKQLLSDGKSIALQGFGTQVREAMSMRVDFLTEHGLAKRHGQTVVLARNLLATLRERDVKIAAKAIEEATGLLHRPVPDAGRVSGVYRRSTQLVSGRFAVLDDGTNFSLVPWRPVIEQRLGQALTAVVRPCGVSWQFGRQQGIATG